MRNPLAWMRFSFSQDDPPGPLFRVLALLFAQLPWLAFYVASMPWGLGTFLVRGTCHPNLILKQCVIVTTGVSVNWVAALVWFLVHHTSAQAEQYPPICAAIAYVAAMNGLFKLKTYTRWRYGIESRANKEIDEGLFSLLGIVLLKRGLAYLYIYPLCAAIPATCVYVVSTWFCSARLPLTCAQINGTPVDCVVTSRWSLSAALPYVLSNCLAAYGCVKFLAMYLVKYDPVAEGQVVTDPLAKPLIIKDFDFICEASVSSKPEGTGCVVL